MGGKSSHPNAKNLLRPVIVVVAIAGVVGLLKFGADLHGGSLFFVLLAASMEGLMIIPLFQATSWKFLARFFILANGVVLILVSSVAGMCSGASFGASGGGGGDTEIIAQLGIASGVLLAILSIFAKRHRPVRPAPYDRDEPMA
jgi:hypothetical protein